MSILSLDLGTKTGWAKNTRENGVWNFKPSQFDSASMRFVKFRRELIKLIKEVNLITYEEVRMHNGVLAAQIYGGFVAVLQITCHEYGVNYLGVPVGTIKKSATGKGNAKKEDMIRAANKIYPKVNIIDDNHADALCLLNYSIHYQLGL